MGWSRTRGPCWTWRAGGSRKRRSERAPPELGYCERRCGPRSGARDAEPQIVRAGRDEGRAPRNARAARRGRLGGCGQRQSRQSLRSGPGRRERQRAESQEERKTMTTTPGAAALKMDTRSAYDLDLRDVRGQMAARRALEIAAAGGHHLLMVGPPGCGKTMLATRLPGLLPEREDGTECPFRAPHHTAGVVSMLGGGKPPGPGEVTLADGGVLFLDELPEFTGTILEALREPLETGTITLMRASERTTLPARFQLVAAMSPCPCGACDESQGGPEVHDGAGRALPRPGRADYRAPGYRRRDEADSAERGRHRGRADGSGARPGASGARDTDEAVGDAESGHAARGDSRGRTGVGGSRAIPRAGSAATVEAERRRGGRCEEKDRADDTDTQKICPVLNTQ